MEMSQDPDHRPAQITAKSFFAKEEVLSDLRSIREFWRFVLLRFHTDQCVRMAASLSYTTLLAIVPLSAIAFAMLAAFPVFEGVRGAIQEAIFSNLLPESAENMREYFERFVNNTAGLTAVGIIGLALTAVLLLGTIESALNTIFRVTKPRPLLPRLLVFWALITLGPLLIGASFSLSTYFFAVTNVFGVSAGSDVGIGLTKALPTTLLIIALFVTYLVIPNRAVDVRGALIGGVAAGLLFAGLRYLFALYVGAFPVYQTIYGAVSVIPIVLIWTYLSWVIVLMGGVFTAAYGDWRASGGRPSGRRLVSERRLLVALEIIDMIYQRSRAGETVSRRDMLKETGIGDEALGVLLDELRGAKIIEATKRENWLLVRDVDHLTLNDLLSALHLGIGSDHLLDQKEGWRGRLAACVRHMKSAQDQSGDVSMRSLLSDANDANPVDELKKDNEVQNLRPAS